MSDPRINPSEIQIGDLITSHPTRDFRVHTLTVDDFGDVLINEGTPDQARIRADQTVTVMPRHIVKHLPA